MANWVSVPIEALSSAIFRICDASRGPSASAELLVCYSSRARAHTHTHTHTDGHRRISHASLCDKHRGSIRDLSQRCFWLNVICDIRAAVFSHRHILSIERRRSRLDKRRPYAHFVVHTTVFECRWRQRHVTHKTYTMTSDLCHPRRN